ncbi:MAG: F0F1 ATP synthase subunit delta [Candidatus Margulisbacteria bacterium]|jgi:F0F1-type ATP synthase delta subunit|nr:F0F1 ATP synthase subunit delta [Candidatus Margulisiibacteriota bacterium]
MKTIDAAKLYELAGEKAVPLEEELHLLADKLLKNLELRRFLAGNAPLTAKREVMSEVLPDSSPLLRRLLDLLFRERLVNKLPWLAERYSAVISERIGACYVEVRHAHKLREQDKIQIFSLIEGGCRVRFVEDRTVIGGVKLRWQDGRYFDTSLAGDLQELKEALLV